MRYAGIKTIAALIRKAGIEESTYINDFDAEFVKNFEILEDTAEAIEPSAQPADRSVGISSAYIEEHGASVDCKTSMSKENATALLLTFASFEKYLAGRGRMLLQQTEISGEIESVLREATMSALSSKYPSEPDYDSFDDRYSAMQGRYFKYDTREFAAQIAEDIKVGGIKSKIKNISTEARVVYILMEFYY
jgi:hypothetical protein